MEILTIAAGRLGLQGAFGEKLLYNVERAAGWRPGRSSGLQSFLLRGAALHEQGCRDRRRRQPTCGSRSWGPPVKATPLARASSHQTSSANGQCSELAGTQCRHRRSLSEADPLRLLLWGCWSLPEQPRLAPALPQRRGFLVTIDPTKTAREVMRYPASGLRKRVGEQASSGVVNAERGLRVP
jgi:hypothetical protein